MVHGVENQPKTAQVVAPRSSLSGVFLAGCYGPSLHDPERPNLALGHHRPRELQSRLIALPLAIMAHLLVSISPSPDHFTDSGLVCAGHSLVRVFVQVA